MASVPYFHKRWPGASQILLSPGEINLHRYSRLIGFTRREEMKKNLFSLDFQQSAREVDELENWPEQPREFSKWSFFHQLLYWDQTLRLPDCIVLHLDRMSMAHSLEARVPFLDHELFEFCAGIPEQFKLKGLTEKYILRRAMSGLLPQEILNRKKFATRAPTRQWFLEDLPEFAKVLLSREQIKKKGYFNPEFVLLALDKHRSGAMNYANLLMAILGMQLWDEIFVRGNRNEV